MYTDHARAASHGLRIGMLVAVDEQGRTYTLDIVAEGGKAVVDTVGAVMQPPPNTRVTSQSGESFTAYPEKPPANESACPC